MDGSKQSRHRERTLAVQDCAILKWRYDKIMPAIKNKTALATPVTKA
jgi:hypothetical protein